MERVKRLSMHCVECQTPLHQQERSLLREGLAPSFSPRVPTALARGSRVSGDHGVRGRQNFETKFHCSVLPSTQLGKAIINVLLGPLIRSIS